MDKTFNKAKGDTAEIYALTWLEGQGFSVLEINWKGNRGEIDIIAQSPSGAVHFIEVKAKSTCEFGLGREAVTPAKQRTIRRVATEYLLQENLYNQIDISFDVIEVNGTYPDYQIEFLDGCF